ncbi:CD99 molecule isoform X2 [Mastacembelus armatus]|uniref:CD99 molecule isoform X2 n=1 Tax=Mastacembelus armatus TaxID=205130 RepID=UPI000E46062B|nr:basic salivary proline-rich protein 4-like isoform X2 [Mastacembelus armatus]
MKFCLRIALLVFLVNGTLTQEGFDLSDALEDPPPTPAKPKDKPKAPEKPKTDSDFGLDLEDALGPDPHSKPDKPPVIPPKSGGGDFGLDLEDALGPDPHPKPDKPPVTPPKSGGGGGSFGDSDLFDVSGGDYKPDGGRSGGRAVDPGYDQGGADQPQDPDLPWDQIVKILNANIPEEFIMWISNLKQMFTPLVETLMNLLQAVQ